MAPTPKNERQVILDIAGNVVESKFENGVQIYATDKISVDTLKVITPAYVAPDNTTVAQKEVELIKLTKWAKSYTKGSSDVTLSQTGGINMGKFAFINMCEAIAKMQRTA